MNPTTAENELRGMIGDLMMQLAMLRADNANMKIALEKLSPQPATPRPNGKDEQHEQPGA